MAIPLPKVVADVGPGGPFVTSARGLNSLRREQAEAQYAPYTNYANALSKMAYAQYSPANAIAQIMSGPGAAQLSREQATALANQFQNILKNSGNYSNNLPVPNTGALFGNSLAGNLFSALINKIAPNSQNNMNNIPTNNQGMNNLQISPNLPTETSISSPEVSSGGGRYEKIAKSLRMPGAQGGENPQTGAEAEKARLVTGAGAEATSQVQQQNKMEENDINQANASVEMLNQLKKLRDARSRLYPFEKGSFAGIPLGTGPAITSAAQEADRARSSIANAIASMVQSGHINVADREIALSMKAGREVNDEAFENLTNYAEGAAYRVNEKPAFNRAMASVGLTPSETQILWANYNLKKPFYNSKTHKLDQANLGSWESFYGNQKNIKGAFSPESQKKLSKVNKDVNNGNVERQFDLTGFKDEADFQKWFKAQNKDTQKYVERQIRAGVY